jgi:hypothetical protein
MTGFNKRIFTKENILMNLDNIINYLNCDAAYLKDEFSLIIFRMYSEGKTKEEILEKIKQLNDE